MIKSINQHFKFDQDKTHLNFEGFSQFLVQLAFNSANLNQTYGEELFSLLAKLQKVFNLFDPQIKQFNKVLRNNPDLKLPDYLKKVQQTIYVSTYKTSSALSYLL